MQKHSQFENKFFAFPNNFSHS